MLVATFCPSGASTYLRPAVSLTGVSLSMTNLQRWPARLAVQTAVEDITMAMNKASSSRMVTGLFLDRESAERAYGEQPLFSMDSQTEPVTPETESSRRLDAVASRL